MSTKQKAAAPVRLTYVSASVPEGYTVWKDAKGRTYRLYCPAQDELKKFAGKGYTRSGTWWSKEPLTIQVNRKLLNKYLVEATPQPRPKVQTVTIPGTNRLCDEYYIDRTYPTPNALLQATRRALIKVVGNAEALDSAAADRYGGFSRTMTVRQAILKQGKYSQDASAGTIIDVNMHSHIYIAERH